MRVARKDGLHVATLASGSRGNCTWIGTQDHGVLIDCGVSAKQVLARLDAVGLGDAPIDAVLITHEHTDHVAAAGVLERRFARAGRTLPFYLTAGTAAALPDKVRPSNLHPIAAGSRIPWGGGWLEAWPVPHDTVDPVCWVVQHGEARAGVVTDLGHAPRLISGLLATLDVAVLEFNHDEQMLLDGHYPWPLKQRVRGRHGHLSNRAAAEALATAAQSGRIQDVLLGHLSRDNNTADHARDAADRALHRAGHRARVHLADQDTPTPPIAAHPPAMAQTALF